MISLLEIAQSINEADDDKYVSIGFGRFKLKGKEDDDDADVFVKTDSGKYVKSADQKSDDDGGKKPEEPQGGKLSGSDFDRDGGDSEKVDGPSPEDDWDNEQVMTAKIGGEEVGDIIDNPNHPNYDKAMDYVMSFNPDDEKLVTGPGSDIDGPSPEDDWDNEQVMTAKINGEEVGDIINNPNHTNYDKAMDYVMSFNPDDEKLVTGPGSDDDMDDDKNAPERENEKIEKELQDIAKDKGLTVGSEDANYGGEIHSLVGKDDDPDNALGFHAAPNFDDDGNMTNEPQYAIELGMGTSPMYFGSKEEADSALQKIVGDERIRKAMDGESDETLFDLGDHAKSIVKGKDETITINGKQYKPIKESGKTINVNLKEKYDRIFRSLK